MKNWSKDVLWHTVVRADAFCEVVGSDDSLRHREKTCLLFVHLNSLLSTILTFRIFIRREFRFFGIVPYFFSVIIHPISKKNHVTFYFCHCHLFSNSMKRSEVDQCCNRIIGTVNGLVCYLPLLQTTSRHKLKAFLPCRSSSSFPCSSAPSLSDPSARLLEVSPVEPSPGMFRILFKIEWLQAIAHHTSNPCF